MATKGKDNKTASQKAKEYAHKLWAIFYEKFHWAVVRANRYANLVTALATTIITILTFFVIKISNQQVADSRATQRAFVNIASPSHQINRIFNPQTNQIEQLEVFTIWENSGNTPTRNMTVHENYKPLEGPIPDDFPYTDIWDSGKPKVNIPVSLGPKQRRWGYLLKIKPQDVQKAIKGDLRLYFYGWARYHDVFFWSKEHLMEFCRELIFDDGAAALDPTVPTINTRMIDCPNHNCTDEECADYKEATKQ